MNCKNCHTQLADEARFCSHCGAKVINTRITSKLLFQDFVNNFLGWDNSFFKTIKTLLIKPDLVITDYLNGVRKRYMNPFVFIALGTAISLFIFNAYSDEYMKSYEGVGNFYKELMVSLAGEEFVQSEEFQKSLQEQNEANRASAEFTIKYFNLMTFLFIPLYALISLLVFDRRYNFGEYIIITCYLQGLIMYFTIILFIISLYVNTSLFLYSFLLSIPYYLYTFGRLMKLNIFKLFLKLLLFVLVTIALAIVLIIIGALITIATQLIPQIF